MTTSTRSFFAAIFYLSLLAGAPALAQQFVDGLAQPVFAGQAVIRHNVWVEIPNLDTDRDGVNDRIRIQVNRPQATENGTQLPIVLMASPYSGGQRPFPQYDITGPLYVPPSEHQGYQAPDPLPPPPPGPETPYFGNEAPIPNISTSGYQTYFLPRGFIFAYANSLGTGNSTGCATIGGIEESLAMKAAIDWFNGKGAGNDVDGNRIEAYWTTGATTMIGVSYDGTLPIAAASTGVEGLKAIVPIAGVSSYYDHRRSYGTVINSNPSIGTDADTLFDNILTRKYPEACSYMRELLVNGMDRQAGDYNDWWNERNYVNYVRKFTAAVFISHGLNDFNVKPRHFARLYAALKKHGVPAKIWLNQGGHGDGANTIARRDAWRDALNRFWSHYLFGIDNGAMDGPKALVEREDRQWVEYADWPAPGAKATTFSLQASGDNSVGGLAVGVNDGYEPVYEQIIDNSTIDLNLLAAAAQSPHRLIYKSVPLTAPVHISGIPSVLLCISFSEPAAIVSAALVDYRPNGTVQIITRGWADPQNRTLRSDPQNRAELSGSAWVQPGEQYEMAFELQPHDYVFQAGSRIGVVLLSSERLFTLRPPAGTVLTVDSRWSTVKLPVVGGQKAFLAALQTPQ